MPATLVFISYTSKDKDAADRLKTDLEAHGISVWIDRDELPPDASDFGEAILTGLRQCQALIYVASPAARASKYSREELHMAKHYGIRVYPFWIEGAYWEDVAPYGFTLSEYTDAREFADYEGAFGKLLNALQKNVTPMKSTETSESSEYETRPEIPTVPVINPLVAPTIPPTPTDPAPIEPKSPMEPASQGTQRKGENGGFKRFRLVAVALIAVLLLSGTSAVFLMNRPGRPPTGTPTVAPTQRPPRWEIVANPNLGSKNVLYGVDAIAADDVWAAGYYRNNPSSKSQFTLIEHWDGSSWTQVASPNGKADTNVLNGIKAVASSDVWAVGDSGTSSLIEHWKGSSWVTVPSPNVGAYQNYLNAVTAWSATDIWAVGSSRDTSEGSARTLIEHWDGSRWQVTPSPNLGSGNNILYGVTALTADNVWVAGFSRSTPSSSAHPLIEHWYDFSWHIVSAPSVGSGDNVFNGLAAVAANDIWAVGYSEKTSNDPARSLIERWDGSSWTPIASPNIGAGDNVLYGVTVLKSDDVWAAGGGVGTLIVHWDSSSWQSVTSLNIDPTRNILNSISAVDADDIWSVGVYGGASQTSSNYTLNEHWTNS